MTDLVRFYGYNLFMPNPYTKDEIQLIKACYEHGQKLDGQVNDAYIEKMQELRELSDRGGFDNIHDMAESVSRNLFTKSEKFEASEEGWQQRHRLCVLCHRKENCELQKRSYRIVSCDAFIYSRIIR